MQLSSLLDSELIYFEEESKSKDQILADMVDMVCTYYHCSKSHEDLLQKIYQRESESSTVYPCGVAVPHIRLENFNDTQICICFPRRPYEDNNLEVKMVVLVITNNGSNQLYLNLVATLMRLCKNADLMNVILNEKSGGGVFHTIENTDLRVHQELIIADVMSPNPWTINQNATLKELADLMAEHKINFVPVVDDSGVLVGEINILAYLKTGVPDYLMLMNNLHFLRNFDALNHISDHEGSILVKSLMKPATEVTYPTSSIIKVVFKMIQLNLKRITVIDQKKVVGVVTAMDILTKAIRS